jgi:hypothetical protein
MNEERTVDYRVEYFLNGWWRLHIISSDLIFAEERANHLLQERFITKVRILEVKYKVIKTYEKENKDA